jgi:hypothetical protein
VLKNMIRSMPLIAHQASSDQLINFVSNVTLMEMRDSRLLIINKD